MSSTIEELRPDRRLLDSDFEGYKLNLHSLAHWSIGLSNAVDKVHPSESQYSFVHAKLFSLHNHLAADSFDHSYNFYYVDNLLNVCQITFDAYTRQFEKNTVYSIPLQVERQSGNYNICILFPTSDIAVISDGTGFLHIIATGNRSIKQCNWTSIHIEEILTIENKYFVLLDCRVMRNDETMQIHCLLQSLEQRDDQFSSTLTWVGFEGSFSNLRQSSIRQITGKGVIHYAAIESSLSALYIASDHQFKFISDSEREIVQNNVIEKPKLLYTWSQTSEDISITMKLPEEHNKTLFNVSVSHMTIKVMYAGDIFLDGKLKHCVDSHLTTWNIDNGTADILLTKTESCLWSELIEGGDVNGEEIVDTSIVEEVHQRLQHLCSDTVTHNEPSAPGLTTQHLEECDAASEEDTFLVRLDAATHEISHRIPLSVHQYLFTLPLESREVPALVLRHDVDGCVWQPFAKLVNTNNWPLKHEGTLNAFGYIQSSKQNRKFLTCSPDFSYSVVCEVSKHIFVYKKSGMQGCNLRQRVGNKMVPVKVGQQFVFNIDSFGEILGIQATKNYLFLLSDKHFVAIEI